MTTVKSIRPFVGALNFDISRQFYRDIGFEEIVIGEDMSYFNMDATGFYLQKYYVKEWIENTMLLIELEDVDAQWERLSKLNLPENHTGSRLSAIKNEDWARVFYLHDPAGVLWYYAQFKN